MDGYEMAKKQRGSAHVIIIIFLLLGLMIALGWIFYQNFIKQDTSKITPKTIVKSTMRDLAPAGSCQSKNSLSDQQLKPVVIDAENSICIWTSVPNGWSNNASYKLSGFGGTSETDFDDLKDGSLSRVIDKKLYIIKFILTQPKDDFEVSTYNESDYNLGVIDDNLFVDKSTGEGWESAGTIDVRGKAFYIAKGHSFPLIGVVSTSPFNAIGNFPGNGDNTNTVLTGNYPSIELPAANGSSTKRHLKVQLSYVGRVDGNNQDVFAGTVAPQIIYDDLGSVVRSIANGR